MESEKYSTFELESGEILVLRLVTPGILRLAGISVYGLESALSTRPTEKPEHMPDEFWAEVMAAEQAQNPDNPEQELRDVTAQAYRLAIALVIGKMAGDIIVPLTLSLRPKGDQQDVRLFSIGDLSRLWNLVRQARQDFGGLIEGLVLYLKSDLVWQTCCQIAYTRQLPSQVFGIDDAVLASEFDRVFSIVAAKEGWVNRG